MGPNETSADSESRKDLVQGRHGRFYIYERPEVSYQLLAPHVKNHWSNPPRRRRHFMKSLVTWHQLYGLLMEIVDGLKPSVSNSLV
jgi:hypothetical protein